MSGPAASPRGRVSLEVRRGWKSMLCLTREPVGSVVLGLCLRTRSPESLFLLLPSPPVLPHCRGAAAQGSAWSRGDTCWVVVIFHVSFAVQVTDLHLRRF